ncbi:MAG: alanine--tRNA ligase [Candidatus Aenigmatarchaeota archaeon]
MNSDELKRLYIDFFKKKKHAVIPNVSLIPENDSTVLFTTAGMHPLVPFLLGQPHPQGKRLVNVQKCFRTSDIDEVGDDFHLSFFEMLGNWSLGDYFKEQSISWSFEFLTNKEWLGIDKEKLFVTVFEGDENVPRDNESAKIWEGLGISKERIYYLPKKDNWWGPAGNTGPCGPDTEIFYDTGKEVCGKDCKPGCSCGKYNEIWNNVFMQYNKKTDSVYEELEQKNVDTGMGVERTIAVLQGKDNVYDTKLFAPLIKKIKELSKNANERSIRIITDHMRATSFILAENIVPKNVEQGYVLRRLIRRSIRHGKLLGIEEDFLTDLANIVIENYKKEYPHLEKNKEFIIEELKKEEKKFKKTLEKGLRKFKELTKDKKELDGKEAFLLFQSYGFPIEITKELGEESGIEVDAKGFCEEFEKHQNISRSGAEKKFGSGLADTSEKTIRLHTATHLLNQALRKVLKKDDIYQRGSNITPERLRFDFNFDRKLTDDELKQVEDLVNQKIKEAIPVKRIETSFDEAKKMGAQGVFEEKYGEKVFVYSIGDFSCEICSGPHVENTKGLGHFKIVKEKGIAAGVRRIRAVLD